MMFWRLLNAASYNQSIVAMAAISCEDERFRQVRVHNSVYDA